MLEEKKQTKRKLEKTDEWSFNLKLWNKPEFIISNEEIHQAYREKVQKSREVIEKNAIMDRKLQCVRSYDQRQ